MERVVLFIVVAACVTAEDKWVWQKRDQRAFSSSQDDRYGNGFYPREKDREPTTRRPSTAQSNDEDFLNPDDLRNYNGVPGFGNPQAGGVQPNNFLPGFGIAQGANNPQGYPNQNPGFLGPGQPNYPTAPESVGGGFPTSGSGGYPTSGPGYYPSIPNNGYPPQGGYPSSIPSQPYPALPGSGPGYPGIGNVLGPGTGFQGQATYPVQNPNIAGQGGYPFPGFTRLPYPIQVPPYPNQPGYPGPQGYPQQYPGQQGYPTQFPSGPNYAQLGAPYPQPGQYPIGQYPTGQYPNGQFVGCGQFGFPPCPGGQIGQYPIPYPGQYPYQYPTPGEYPNGQYPYPNPDPNNPYGITPYSKDGVYASGFDDYDESIKNNTNKTLKPEGKSFNLNTSVVPKSSDFKIHKSKRVQL